MRNTYKYNGRTVVAHRSDFYCKRGPYTHGWVKGWELIDAFTGEVVVSGEPRNRGADRSARIPFPTKATLLNAKGLI